jgi:molybdenum cofactor cytidylyltransferase
MIYGIIVSAGLSGRMGKFKPLLNFEGKSFIQNIVLKLNSVCDKVIIVTGYKAELIEDNVNQLNIYLKIKFVHNENYEKGMFRSLQAGLREAENCDWVLYHFVDQPGLPENFYTEFVKQIDDKHNWLQPEFNGRKGHPLLIKKELIQVILDAPLNSNLRSVSNDQKVIKKFWECSYAQILQDIDTPQDYARIKKNEDT